MKIYSCPKCNRVDPEIPYCYYCECPRTVVTDRYFRRLKKLKSWSIFELFRFRRNIFRPTFHVYARKDFRNENYSIYDLKLGVYIKPIAYLIKRYLQRRGWSVKVRGRGQRSGKYRNYDKDIRIQDSIFLSVYARKRVRAYGVNLF